LNRTADTGVLSVEETAQPHDRNKPWRVCPECGKARARRSRRRSVTDHLLGAFGLRPYRCHECDYRYHARGRTRARRSHWAHCPRCGFTGVNRIARQKVPSTWKNFPWRVLSVSAYRCPECRNLFFDYRPQRPKEAETP